MPVMQPIAMWSLLLCGPMVRRVEPHSVSVFVALKHDRTVKLSIYLYNPNPNAPREFEMGTAQRRTVPLGKYLHVAVVTLNKELPEDPFKPGQVYAYDLDFIKPAGVTDDGPDGASLDSLGLLQEPYVLGYVNGQLPSFSLAPGLKELHLLHASCRKPHAPGRDALRVIDKVIAEARAASSVGDFALQRPHQLFLTGDQIYADDVALSLLKSLSATGKLLLSWPASAEEKLSVASPPIAAPAETKERSMNDSILNPGKRQIILKDPAIGFTSGEAGGHLMFLAEYYAMYLFAWSDDLWPREANGTIELPTLSTVLDKTAWPQEPGWIDKQSPEYKKAKKLVEAYKKQFKKEEGQFEDQRDSVHQFAMDLPIMRRVFANIPTYMIFDDHEVTDDWFLHKAWNDRVRANTLGRRILRNGLTAFALFQAWGNTPQEFESGNGKEFLAAVQSWQNGPFDPDNKLESLLNVGELPSAVNDRLIWDYVVSGMEHQAVVLDTRTWRDFPLSTGIKQKLPPALIAMSSANDALKRQLDDRKPNTFGKPPLTLVVSPAPVLGFPFMEQEIQPIGAALGHQETVDNEAWGANVAAFEEFLRRLARFGVAVILSGDVHYGFTSHTAYFDHRDPSNPIMARFVQLCASALKNQAGLTLVPHLLGGNVPEVREDWFGYQSSQPIRYHPGLNLLVPLERQKHIWRLKDPPYVIPATGWGLRVETPPDPDWRYRIVYLRHEGEAPESLSSVIKTLEAGQLKVVRQALHYGKASLATAWRHVVGFNNVGQVKFSWDNELNKAMEVVHSLWWAPDLFPPFDIEPKLLTMHTAPLSAPLLSEMPEWKPLG